MNSARIGRSSSGSSGCIPRSRRARRAATGTTAGSGVGIEEGHTHLLPDGGDREGYPQ